MRFWKKFWILAIASSITISLHLFTNDIGRIDLILGAFHVSASLYIILAFLLSFWLICFVIRSFFIWFLSLFFKNRTAEEIISTNKIANLIVLDNNELNNNIEKTHVSENLKILITALILKNNIKTKTYIEKTGLPSLDIYIIKRNLKELLEENNITKAIDISENTIKKYHSYINIIKDEILEVAKHASSQELYFKFDPRKYKYNLPQGFIDRYFIEIALINIEKITQTNNKIKYIEKLYKNYPNNIDISERLLDILEKTNTSKNNDKKIIELVKNSFTVKPDRKYAYTLLKLEKNDIFEITQEITKNINDNNLEKMWILLIIATHMRFTQKIKELVEKIVKIDNSNEIFKFFVINHALLEKQNEIIKILDTKNEYKI